MKSLFAIFAALFILTSCTKSRIVIAEGEIPEDIFYLEDNLEPFTGTCIIMFHGTEKIKEEINFKEGMLHGPAISYYPDGSKKREGAYNQGKLHGKWESWYPNGKKNYTVEYSNDSLSGAYSRWFETGVLMEKGVYAQNSRKGLWVEYDEAGMIVEKKNFN